MGTNDNATSAFVETNYVVRSGATRITPYLAETTAGFSPRTAQNITLYFSEDVTLDKVWTVTASNLTDTNSNQIVTNGGANTLIVSTIETLVDRESNLYDYADDGFFNSDHRYYDTAWAQPSFDAAAAGWNFGQSAFYKTTDSTPPPNGNRTLCCTDDNDVDFPSKTYYFRVPFEVNGSLFNGVYQMKYFLADGAIMYVNGKEVWRTNIAASVTNPTYDNLASAGGSLSWLPAGTNYITLPLGGFVQPGANLLAVEVHTSSTSDPVVGWGVELIHRYTNLNAGPLTILTQPQSVSNVVEGGSAKFAVVPDGKAPYKYQWLVVTAANVTNTLAGQTNRTLDIDNVPLAYNNGRVLVRVTGGTPATTLTSSNAFITVVADATAPALLSADFDADEGGVVVTFSEPMKSTTLLDKANYILTNGLGAAVTITSVSNIDGESVVLKTTGAPTIGNRWVLNTKNLTDNSVALNPLPTTQSAVVGGRFILVPMLSDWRYYGQGTNGPVGSNWTQRTYTEVPGWQTGTALFWNTSADLPETKNTFVPLINNVGSNVITFYFRKTFDFPGNTNGLKLLVDRVIDDGLVLWINGSTNSSLRFNMPSTGTPSYTTFATVAVGDAIRTNGISISYSNLVSGVNQLAAEVHRRDVTSDQDMAFGLQVYADYSTVFVTNAPPQAPPTVTIDQPLANASSAFGAAINIAATVAPGVGGSITKVEFFDGAALLNSDTAAPYAFSWVNATVGAHTIRVVATDNKSQTTEKTVSITVTQPVPTLTIDSPAPGASFVFGAAINIAATAASPGGSITKVEFFDGAALLNSDTVAPYAYSWTTAAVGNHTIKVIATDNKSQTTEKTVSITVPQPAPTLTIDSPANNAAITQGDSLSITATAAALAGATISKVEFFDGATKISEDTSAPYAATWATTTGTTVGNHTIRVVATDSRAAVTEKTITVKVNEAVPVNIKLTVTASPDRKSATITWPTANGFVLQSSPSVSSPSWTDINGAVSGVVVPITGAPKYYRLKKP